MAVYTNVDPEALNAFLADYGLPPADHVEGITEGVENSNYRLTIGTARYILTLYEKRVDPNDLPYFLSLMNHVVDRDVQAAAPITDQHGRTLKTLSGKPAALIAFLDGNTLHSPTTDQAEKTGAALAQFHRATMDFSGERENSLGPEGWQDLIDTLGTDLDTREAGLHAEMKATLEKLNRDWPKELPRGTIHADLFPDNVLFSGDTMSGLIDFYFSCTDFYAYDLAVCLNAWTPEGSVDGAIASSFYKGYTSVRQLTAPEINALPTLLCGAAMRFFLTRTYDDINRVPGSVVVIKDPTPYLSLLRFHRDTPEKFIQGLQ